MPLQLLKYNPGVVKDITEYAAGKNGPYWVDSDLVRFKNGYPEKLGGWQKDNIFGLDPSGNITTTQISIEGIARRMVYWRAFADGEDRLAVGTHNHLFIYQNNALFDITPLRKTSSGLSNPIATVDGSSTVTITDTSHGATTGDWVVLSGTSATGGIAADTLNDYYGWTHKFIYPPYDFSLANSMITNFHMPKSTLLMMVSAFGGVDIILKAYKEAIKKKYNFFSYGDAMMII